ncbi:SpoVK ATPase of the AAA+ class [Pyrenophora tritici-repentis]|nr:SpoVK ATPase AAA+ class [Pyrenophora tritici-repentis]KAI1547842.1 SpoVK ATPase of the AAA+ class [Pyrenophora tritici-repentis]KAI1576808.1 SpoVK ATPase of the AAA+ class [Pyrenophora tritici-repentis]KAI1589685.1 SpoVK ATPase of the AAA+ class [Pyrenophora tritici-repentis]KAI1599207.1 SpoVK ATPase of the AAA+ class [Pyrenophora tritici-repentis]
MDHLSMLLDMDLDGPNTTSNTTLGALPSLLLNQSFPGYSLLSQLLQRHLGVDVSVILPTLFGFWALFYSGRAVYMYLYDYVLVYFVSTLHIERADNLYDSTMDWPLKDLLCNIKVWDSEKEVCVTAVWRPAPRDTQERRWERSVSRMARPISTVSLDLEQKVNLVRDINEYLQPVTARGIPHRRGYLFHGPPGTGKTSLSFALAGILGLNVHCISLNERGLTELCLNQLFKDLPRRCIVLLEDIDPAGLRREELDSNSDPSPAGPDDAEDSVDSGPDGPYGPGDDAHYDPYQQEMMMMMEFARSRMAAATEVKDSSKKKNPDEDFLKLVTAVLPKVDTFSPERIADMAERFAEQLPEDTFSPAEVQGYLLKKKRDPVQALEEVCKWRDSVLEAKKKGTKVVSEK